MSGQVVQAGELVAVARAIDWSAPSLTAMSDAADARTRVLIDGFVHQAGPPPAHFAWVVFGSHARRELHCASDQDNALFWQTQRAATSGYAQDLAAVVIEGLTGFGLRPCDGGYMADTWSHSLDEWQQILRERVDAPTPDAVLDADVFLDLRHLAGTLDVDAARAALARGASSQRLMHGLAGAANSFPPPLHAFGRLPRGTVDLKKTGLAPIVLLARLYGLKAGSAAVGTDDRLADATRDGVLSEELTGRLRDAYSLLTRLRLQNQLRQIEAREYVTDTIGMEDLDADDHDDLRDAFKAIKSAQTVTSITFRTDL